MKGKMLIVSAPSGSGKSTIVQWLMQDLVAQKETGWSISS